MVINISENTILIKSKVKNMGKGDKCLKIHCIEKDGMIKFGLSTVFENEDRIMQIGNLPTITMYNDHTVVRHVKDGMIED